MRPRGNVDDMTHNSTQFKAIKATAKVQLKATKAHLELQCNKATKASIKATSINQSMLAVDTDKQIVTVDTDRQTMTFDTTGRDTTRQAMTSRHDRP